MADTWAWDEAACRARLAATLPDFAAWQELVRHTPADLRGALAALDVARAECGRLRAALGPFAALARGHDSDSEYSPVVVDHRRGEVLKLFGPDRDSAATLRDCRRAAAALGGDSDG